MSFFQNNNHRGEIDTIPLLDNDRNAFTMSGDALIKDNGVMKTVASFDKSNALPGMVLSFNSEMELEATVPDPGGVGSAVLDGLTLKITNPDLSEVSVDLSTLLDDTFVSSGTLNAATQTLELSRTDTAGNVQTVSISAPQYFTAIASAACTDLNNLTLTAFDGTNSQVDLKAIADNATLDNTGATLKIAASGVGTTEIKDLAATTAKLADDAVTLDKLGHLTSGSILYYGASGAPTELTKGTDGEVLSLASGIPEWKSLSSMGSIDVSSANTALSVSANANDTKLGDSLTLTVEFDDVTVGLGSSGGLEVKDDSITLAKMASIAQGSIIYGDNNGNPAHLSVGANGNVLTVAAGQPSWTAASALGSIDVASANTALSLSTGANDTKLGDTVTLTIVADGSTLQVGTSGLEVVDAGITEVKVEENLRKRIRDVDSMSAPTPGVPASVTCAKSTGSGASVTVDVGDAAGSSVSYVFTKDSFDAASKRITNVLDPTQDQDAVTKKYLYDKIQGLAWSSPADIGYETSQDPSGSLGTSQGSVTFATDLSNPFRVLLVNASSAADNGVWEYNTSGTWARPADYASGDDVSNRTVLVEQGTLAGSIFTQVTNGATVDNATSWSKITGGVTPTMQGASSGSAGAAGLAPQPTAGKQSQALLGDATYGYTDRIVDATNSSVACSGTTVTATGQTLAVTDGATGQGSTSSTTGQLVVTGGTGISENLYVGGNASVDTKIFQDPIIAGDSSTTAVISGQIAIGIGANLNSSGEDDIVIGSRAACTGTSDTGYNVVIGPDAYSTGANCIVIGEAAGADGDANSAIAMGFEALAWDKGVNIGGREMPHKGDVIIGGNSGGMTPINSNDHKFASVCVGYATGAQDNSISIGDRSKASGEGCIVLGSHSQITQGTSTLLIASSVTPSTGTLESSRPFPDSFGGWGVVDGSGLLTWDPVFGSDPHANYGDNCVVIDMSDTGSTYSTLSGKVNNVFLGGNLTVTDVDKSILIGHKITANAKATSIVLNASDSMITVGDSVDNNTDNGRCYVAPIRNRTQDGADLALMYDSVNKEVVCVTPTPGVAADGTTIVNNSGTLTAQALVNGSTSVTPDGTDLLLTASDTSLELQTPTYTHTNAGSHNVVMKTSGSNKQISVGINIVPETVHRQLHVHDSRSGTSYLQLTTSGGTGTGSNKGFLIGMQNSGGGLSRAVVKNMENGPILFTVNANGSSLADDNCKLMIHEGGNVRISPTGTMDTTAPTSALDVVGSLAASGAVTLTGVGAAATPGMLYIDSSGNVTSGAAPASLAADGTTIVDNSGTLTAQALVNGSTSVTPDGTDVALTIPGASGTHTLKYTLAKSTTYNSGSGTGLPMLDVEGFGFFHSTVAAGWYQQWDSPAGVALGTAGGNRGTLQMIGTANDQECYIDFIKTGGSDYNWRILYNSDGTTANFYSGLNIVHNALTYLGVDNTGVHVRSGLFPTTRAGIGSGTIDIGSSTAQWKDLYLAGSLLSSTATISGTTANSYTKFNYSDTYSPAQSDTVTIETATAGCAEFQGGVCINTSGTSTSNGLFVQGNSHFQGPYHVFTGGRDENCEVVICADPSNGPSTMENKLPMLILAADGGLHQCGIFTSRDGTASRNGTNTGTDVYGVDAGSEIGNNLVIAHQGASRSAERGIEFRVGVHLDDGGVNGWDSSYLRNVNITPTICRILYDGIMPMATNAKDLGSSLFKWQTVYATNGTINTSDYRLKKNVSYDFDALALIDRLKPCSFEWKDSKDGLEDESDHTSSTEYGFLAHELDEVHPLAVSGKKDEMTVATEQKPSKPVFQGVCQTKLIGILAKAIKELSAANQALTARVAALEAAASG